MTLGLTSTGAVKTKSDEEGGGLRAVECACCGGCPPVCINGRLVSEYIPDSCYYVDSIVDPCCNDEGGTDSCYAIQITKKEDGTWELYGLNFCVPIAPLFHYEGVIGTGTSIATATWTGWEDQYGVDGEIHDPTSFFSEAVDGQC